MKPLAESLFRKLPQLGELLESEPYTALRNTYSRQLVSEAARTTLDRVRDELRANVHSETTLELRLEELLSEVARELQRSTQPSLRPVINATGVVLQTNLGRAPLSDAALDRVREVASGYCNLEFDLQEGRRSKRDVHVDQLILDVLALRSGDTRDALQGHAAAVVNNCAAATLLALNSLAEGGEVLVSRGELVEIGGGFRVPDILRKSGAILREVGTTNRTRISDYAEAITAQTRLILRVHRSNFRMEGFTTQPSIQELVELGKQASLPVFEDQGTGCVMDLEDLGIQNESSLLQSVSSGVSLVACSGDKLLGGPQCGLLIGTKAHLQSIRANPLFRALRVDKMTYAALEATLQAYLQYQDETLPSVAMSRMSLEAIRTRCESLAQAITSSVLSVEIVAVESVLGGGTTPGATLPSYALAIKHSAASEEQLAGHLRSLTPAIIARTKDGVVLLDLRTVFPHQDVLLQDALSKIPASLPPSREIETDE